MTCSPIQSLVSSSPDGAARSIHAAVPRKCCHGIPSARRRTSAGCSRSTAGPAPQARATRQRVPPAIAFAERLRIIGKAELLCAEVRPRDSPWRIRQCPRAVTRCVLSLGQRSIRHCRRGSLRTRVAKSRITRWRALPGGNSRALGAVRISLSGQKYVVQMHLPTCLCDRRRTRGRSSEHVRPRLDRSFPVAVP